MIEVKKLSVVYPDGTRAVNEICFTLSENESIALVGANGAGKTSLLLSLVGVLMPCDGSVTVDGTVLSKTSLNGIRRLVGVVFQNPDDQLFMPMIYDDVAFGPRNFGLSEAEVETRVSDALMELGIEHLKNRSSLKLSGGEKRTAAIAAVLAMKPNYLVFDEPTAFLDPRARRKLTAMLNNLSHGKIIATHDLAFAEEACNRVILIKDGEIFADGMPREILHDEQLLELAGI